MLKMNRRQILCACGGLGVYLTGRENEARSETEKYEGPLLVTVHAGGGWDPTMFVDGKVPNAKVEVPYSSPATMGSYTYAPLTLKDGATTLDTVQAFLNDLGPRFLVLNGIDTQTNSHETGVKHVWSGKSFEELPSLAALFAASVVGGKSVSVPFLSVGGYDRTANLVSLTRINNSNTLRLAAVPSVSNAAGPQESWVGFHSEATESRINQALAERDQRLAAEVVMMREKDSFARLSSQRNVDGLMDLALSLPGVAVTPLTAFPSLNYNDNILGNYLRSVEVALHAFASGQAVSANVLVNGFDTHTNHDVQHPAQLGRLALTLRYLFRLADQLQLSNRLYVVVGSDFGRTPTYNDTQGKDHWNVTSMLVAGPGIQGGRVIGKTDDEQRPMRISSTLDSYFDTNAAEGTRITPGHVHRALRRKMGIEDSDASKAFPIVVDAGLDDLLG